MPRAKFRRRRSYRRTRPMVSRRRYGKYNRRRSFGRRRIPAAPITPAKRNVKLKYIETTVNTSPAALAYSVPVIYKMNNAYDVTNAVTNTAMPGFNEWAAFYNRYRVNMFAITARFHNPSNSPCYVGLVARTHDQGNMTTWTEARDQQGNKWARTKLLGLAGSGQDTGTLRLVVPLGSFIGNKAAYRADDSYSALTTGTLTGSPLRIPQCVLWVGSYDGAANHGLIIFQVTVTMYITLWDKRNLTS